ncbi:MAG: ATP-NAD kinase family protein [Halobacteriaceae archaeon]
MRVGFVVNPIAGMGGRVGLKGTDGKVDEARARGAEPRAPDRGIDAVTALSERDPGATILTWGGPMGADAATAAGVDAEVLDHPDAEETGAADTRAAVAAFIDADVDVILFVGGDGTAVDVAEAIADADAETPMLGVPAGVKVFSAVFAVTPRAAGRIAVEFDRTERREVNDIDEDAYRDGEVQATLQAVATVPVADDLQDSKQVHAGSVEALAGGVADDLESDTTYVFGPGGTVGAVEVALGIEPSPLGVDVWRDGTLLVRDGSEADILDALGDDNVVIVSPVGGQGFIFGRGNDQLSPAVLERCSVQIIASRAKLDHIGVLRVDTGDPSVDERLRGWARVRVGRFEHRMMKMV